MAEARERWGGRLPFIMAAVGSAVGLGNVWRFPAVAYKNGGGAFLVPYFVALITAGIPLLIVEYALGQKFQGGAPKAMGSVNKHFRWVGWFALLVGSMISFYYVAIMAWAMDYTVASADLKWTQPAPTRVENTLIPADRVVLYLNYKNEEHKARLEEVVASQAAGETPVLLLSEDELKALEGAEKAKPEGKRQHYVSLDANAGNYFNEICLGGFAPGRWQAMCAENKRIETEVDACKVARQKLADNDKLSVAERRAKRNELDQRVEDLKGQQQSYITSDDMFKPVTRNVIWAGVVWAAIFLIIFKGVRVVGKVVMWTVSIPIVLLAVLLVRGIMLHGSEQGIVYYLDPNWTMLTNPSVWLAAYGQVFFSLSLGFGIMIAYASYMPRESDVSNNAFMTAFANCATSFFAAFAVFSVLGYLAAVNATDVRSVVSGGPGLVFVTYPIAIAKIGGTWGRIIGVTFFSCLLFLGIDSAFSIVEGVITGIRDRFKSVNKTLITALFCLGGFCFTGFFVTRSGLMWLDIVDNWMSNYGLAAVGLLECVAVAYFFRHQELEEFVNERSEIKLGGWFELFIKYITPAVLVFLLGARFLTDMETTYEGYDTIVPWSVTVAGWGVLIAMIAIALALGRNWTKFTWLAAAAVVFVGFRLWLGETDVAAMAAVGIVLLFGGFFTCLRIAMKNQAHHPSPLG
jgi:SNF family Na+-dependent transporter